MPTKAVVIPNDLAADFRATGVAPGQKYVNDAIIFGTAAPTLAPVAPEKHWEFFNTVTKQATHVWSSIAQAWIAVAKGPRVFTGFTQEPPAVPPLTISLSPGVSIVNPIAPLGWEDGDVYRFYDKTVIDTVPLETQAGAAATPFAEAPTITYVRSNGFWSMTFDARRLPDRYFRETTAGFGKIRPVREYWTTVKTAADLSAEGFTAAGGATVAPFATLFNGYALIACTAAAATLTTTYTVPTSYVRHEIGGYIGVNEGTNNVYTYFLQTLHDRKTSLEVWVCNYATGVPEKRLAAKTVSGTPGNYTPLRAATGQLSPEDESGVTSNYMQWLGFEIPLGNPGWAAAYVGPNGAIKLAIRPAVGNQEGNTFYISGYCIRRNPHGVSFISMNSFADRINDDRSTGTNYDVGVLPVAGNYEGMSYSTISTTSNYIFTVPILPSMFTNGLYLSAISHEFPGQGYCQGSYINLELVNSSGWATTQILYAGVGRPKPGHEAPAASRVFGYGQKACGWFVRPLDSAIGGILPYVARPVTSGVNYVQFRLRARFDSAAISGFLIEEGPPLHGPASQLTNGPLKTIGTLAFF